MKSIEIDITVRVRDTETKKVVGQSVPAVVIEPGFVLDLSDRRYLADELRETVRQTLKRWKETRTCRPNKTSPTSS